MELNIVNNTNNHDYDIYFKDLKRYFKKTLKVLGKEDNYSVSLIIVSPLKIKNINNKYRNINKVTDVISFALMDNDDGYVLPVEDIELGDIFINYNRVKTQAKEYEHSEKREFIFLFIHGLLHLMGYDHMNKEDEEVMFGLQKKIIGNLK